jgi:soluble lytic murein transglycosylase
MMQNCWAKIIPALCCSLCYGAPQPPGKPDTLEVLARAYRKSPGPETRAALDQFARAHSGETAALARLVIGITEYEQKDYTQSAADLKDLAARLPSIADYPAYFRAAARVEAEDMDGIAAEAAPAHRTDMASPYAGRAWILEARARMVADAAGAVRLLRDHYADLPQPDGNLALADSYVAANEPALAAEFYQRVYYQYFRGDAAIRAGTALDTLKQSMGAAYPDPLPQQILGRADAMLDAGDYANAAAEYTAAAARVGGLERDQARVRAPAAMLLNGRASSACSDLRSLQLSDSEAEAERLYYLSECGRRLGSDDQMMAAVEQLGKRFPRSSWRLRGLISAGNRFLVIHEPDKFLPLYRTVYEEFPDSASAPVSHWKVTFQAYLRDRADASDLLREHLRHYPTHATAPASLYFLARQAEEAKLWGIARVYYQTLTGTYPNTYYATLSRDRMARGEISGASPDAQASAFINTLSLPRATPVTDDTTPLTQQRISRSRLLRQAGLDDLADNELRFGARNGAQPRMVAMEMAGSATAPYLGLRSMKAFGGDYLNLPLESAPRKFWEYLFPLPYRSELFAGARANGLDPFLLAGLVRQESEFNPEAVSRAKAYGLSQVQPATGRLYARSAGVTRFSTRTLLEPRLNLKIGSTVLKAMLDKNGGQIEQTLASYNAGPNRAAEWATWEKFREPAEFVESIPYTETRDYVQAVLRNADVYRRLYQAGGNAAAAATAR